MQTFYCWDTVIEHNGTQSLHMTGIALGEQYGSAVFLDHLCEYTDIIFEILKANKCALQESSIHYVSSFNVICLFFNPTGSFDG